MGDCCGEMDHGAETCIGFVGPHSDAFEFFDITEEVLDQVVPFVVVWGNQPLMRGIIMGYPDTLLRAEPALTWRVFRILQVFTKGH
ncbi:hypothetical protein JK174_11865 [Acetobacter thailandicus]|nr:hypothetical protein [Acetobacter thailandicus]